MLKEPKNNIYLRSLVVILTISLAAPMAKADFNIDGIAMTWYKGHSDGAAGSDPWSFEIWVDVLTVDSLDHIDITKPGDTTAFTTLNADNDWEWQSGGYSDLASLTAADYPLGSYTFSFYDGSPIGTWITPDSSGLSEPTGPVDFTYPSVNGQTGISTDPTLTWTVGSGAGDALMMGVFDTDTDEDIDFDAPVSIGTTSWTPGSLTAGHEYGLEVSVMNVLGLQTGPAFPTATVNGDTFEYSIMIEQLNEINFTTVPVPGAVLLGILGLSVAGIKLRKHA